MTIKGINQKEGNSRKVATTQKIDKTFSFNINR